MDAPALQEERRVRRVRMFRRIFLVMIASSLPATALNLYLLSHAHFIGGDPDVHGLIAVSCGILGVLVFFIFLYKFQTSSQMSVRRRVIFLGGHALAIALLFWLLIWLGFDSPWRDARCWGSYEFNTAARSWIISVLVIGSITMLGSFFDLASRSTMR